MARLEAALTARTRREAPVVVGPKVVVAGAFVIGYVAAKALKQFSL